MARYGFAFALMVAFASCIFPTQNVSADSVNPGIYSPNSFPYDTAYKEWIAKWWQWTMSIPVSDHPRDDYTEAKCHMKQEGPVWYLPDKLTGKEDRTCYIPAGKAILIPILTGECDYSMPEVKNDQDLRQCAMAGNEHRTISASINGVQVKNLEMYRTQSGFFNITIPQDNLYLATMGNFRAMADGFFLFLEPLPSGEHNFHLKASVLNAAEPSFDFSADWTYHLLIEPSTN